jgi:hypothetical protein
MGPPFVDVLFFKKNTAGLTSPAGLGRVFRPLTSSHFPLAACGRNRLFVSRNDIGRLEKMLLNGPEPMQ